MQACGLKSKIKTTNYGLCAFMLNVGKGKGMPKKPTNTNTFNT